MYSKSWQNTFSKLSNYMKTSKTVGAKDSNIKMGYEKYAYKSFFRNKDQIYIRIADGGDKRPGRYVWGGCKGYWNYVIKITK